MLDAETFGRELAAMVKAQIAPLLDKLNALEKRLDDLPAPKDGKDADPEAVAAIVRDQMKGDLAELRSAVDAIVIPEPATVDVDAIAKAAAQMIPTPKDGSPGRDGQPGKDGAAGEKGRDGLDVKDMFRADGGRLVAVMSDGTTKDLGEYVGKDGAPGADGKGGADGKDGVGVDDLTFEQTGERSAVLRFAKGEHVKEFAITLPGFVDRGVWKDAEEYQPGDGVTYGGSFWIAQAGADGRRDTGKGWRLAVKKGRDGKDGRDGEKGLRGMDGRSGRDLTQLGGDGSKW